MQNARGIISQKSTRAVLILSLIGSVSLPKFLEVKEESALAIIRTTTRADVADFMIKEVQARNFSKKFAFISTSSV
jgi:hypothetical protein